MINLADHSVNTIEALSNGIPGAFLTSVLFLGGSVVLLASKTAAVSAPLFLTSFMMTGSLLIARYALVQVKNGKLEEEDRWLLRGWVTTALTIATMVLALAVFQCNPLSLGLILTVGLGIAASDFYVAYDIIDGRPGKDRVLFTRN